MSDNLLITLAAGLLLVAGPGWAVLARRARRATRGCVYCGTPRRWLRRALGHRHGLCGPCVFQQRYAQRADLGLVYRTALVRAWDAQVRGPELWRRVGMALFYAGLARERAPRVGEAAAVAEAAALGAALARVARREGAS